MKGQPDNQPDRRKPLDLRMPVDQVRRLHVNERNGYGPGDCHCDECQQTMDDIKAMGDFILGCQARGILTPFEDGYEPLGAEHVA